MVSIIATSAIMGLFLLAVVFFMIRGREWRSYSFSVGREEESTGETLGRVLSGPTAWALGFFLLVFGTAGVALAAVGAISLPLPGGNMPVFATFGVMIVVFVVLGTYGLLRDRRRSAAEAVGVTLLLLASLFVLGVTANLLGA